MRDISDGEEVLKSRQIWPLGVVRKPVKPEKFARLCEALTNAKEIATVISAERKRHTENVLHMLVK